MPRRLRVNTAGYAYHVLNRAVARDPIFKKPNDYLAFERALGEVYERLPMRVLGYCLMPNHWHLVLWPAEDGTLSEFMRLLTVTHTAPAASGRIRVWPMTRFGSSS